MNHRSRNRAAFTLLEVLLVLAILGVLAAMVVPALLGRQKAAMIKTTKASIEGLEGALKIYAVDNDGEYPEGTGEQVFGLLLNPGLDPDGNAISPYLEEMPKDAWGQLLNYEYPNSRIANGIKPAIWSSGPNKRNESGAGDDVKNWQ